MSGRAVFLWIALPFVALSALALWWTREPPPAPIRVVPVPLAPEPPPAEPTPEPPAPPPLARPVPPPPRPAPEDPPLPEIPPGTWRPEEVHVALQAIQPLMRQCLRDAEGRHVGPQDVRMRFTLESREGRGHFLRGEVVDSSLQDPFVFACLQDTLEDTTFPAPEGRPPLTLTYPFHSRAAR
ncbi:hypothetical protein [Archangium primigenium]|uniref:hypothetical protein n=1 Tax=[Archangium] primigenium TaxID=2792470 RepID=UPI00195CAC86|nr:hypothetical protein [Archangium primigenium]MBM7118767.1 hypothetical protein [Archangium primigenium]